MILFEKRNERGEIVSTNFNQGIFSSTKVKEREEFGKHGSLKIISDEEDLLKSNAAFNRLIRISLIAFDSIYNHFQEQVKAQSHTIKKIQGQLIQKVEGILQTKKYNLAQNYAEEKQAMVDTITEDPEQAADILLYIHKRINELGAHITSFEILHMGEQIKLDLKAHNIRKLLMSVLRGFEENLNEIHVKPIFKFSDEDAERIKVLADYKTMNAVFYNLFDNAIKYIKPYSELFIELNTSRTELTLSFNMISLRIEPDELDKIFELGYRGKNCKDSNGLGVGMYVIKKASLLNGLKVKVEPEYSHMERIDKQQYILNKFIFTF